MKSINIKIMYNTGRIKFKAAINVFFSAYFVSIKQSAIPSLLSVSPH